jgi:transmembrane sensor
MESKNLEYWLSDNRFKSWVLNSSPEDETFFTEYLRENPTEKETIAKARLLLLHIEKNQANLLENEISEQWNLLKSKQKMPVIGRRKTEWWQIAVAASVLIISGLSIYFWQKTKSEPILFTTKFNETKTLILPDSSEVMLNANSQLSMNPDWEEGNSREVWLKGEGYFKVKKKVQKNSFEVHTDKLNIKVLGTIFNVLARKSVNNVMLEEGKVEVNSTAFPSQLMKPNELITWTDKALVKSTVVPNDYNAWLRKQLIFKGVKLKEVVQRLEDLYGLQIELNPKLAQKQFTAVLPSQNSDAVLDALMVTFGLKMKKVGDKIILE